MQLQFSECKLSVSCVPSWLRNALAGVGKEMSSVLGKGKANTSNMHKTPPYFAYFEGVLPHVTFTWFLLAKDT